MNSLEELYDRLGNLPTHKWRNYFWIYEKHLEKFVNRAPRMLEIGVQRGGSTQLFKEWLGSDSVIVGVDIDPACKEIDFPDGISIEVGDQESPGFLEDLILRHGPFDIVLDDGGHMFGQISTSFQHLFHAVTDGGVYIIEDTCCQFWDGSQYQGSEGQSNFRDFVWDIYKSMNIDMGSQALFEHWHIPPEAREDVRHDVSPRRYIKAISLYESILIVDKGFRPIPYSELRQP